jgi:hypothetical protein
MLVGTHNRTADEDLFKVGVVRKLGEYRMPYACHRPTCKAFVTLFQGPKSGGRSRHGLPVRAIHSTGLDKQPIVPCGSGQGQ